MQKEQFVTGAVRDSQDNKGNPHLIRYTVLERLAQVMKRGATKYSSRNWEKGMPVERCYDSAFRHLTMFMEEQITGKKMGEEEDDHLAQCVFNCMAMMVILEGIEDGTYPPSLGVNYAPENEQAYGAD